MKWKGELVTFVLMAAVLCAVSFSHLAWGGRSLPKSVQQNVYVLLGGRISASQPARGQDPVTGVLLEENRRLHELLALRARLEGRVVSADVTRREPETWWSELEVEFELPESPSPWWKEKAAVVLTSRGAIGRLEGETVSLSRTARGQSLARGTVTLLSSPQTQLSVVVGEKATPFLLEGKGTGELALRPVVSGAESLIGAGDPVVTAGLGQLYSQGLQVGLVKDAKWATFTSCASTPAEVLLWWR